MLTKVKFNTYNSISIWRIIEIENSMKWHVKQKKIAIEAFHFRTHDGQNILKDKSFSCILSIHMKFSSQLSD